jgi:magnesium transporter
MKSRRRRSSRPRFQRQTQPGASPGTLRVDPRAAQSVVHVLAYGPDVIEEYTGSDLERVRSFRERFPVVWVNVDGLGDQALLASLAEMFHLHPLAMEDVVNVHQRAKVEDYDDHLFIVARMASYNDKLETEQLSLFLGKGFVVTFQEDVPGDCFDPLRERLRQSGGRTRRSGADYLAYALVDAVVDRYFPMLEEYGERLDSLEDAITAGGRFRWVVTAIHDIKRDLRTLRRAVWPLREAVNSLVRESSDLLGPETRVYLRDCYDHTVQILDLVETDRETSSDLMDLHLSHLGLRTNEVMKVLTIITTIFIPLSFIVGVYGMNFDPDSSPFNMPELRWVFGYPACLALMAFVTIALVIGFWSKGWIGRPPEWGSSDKDSSPSA